MTDEFEGIDLGDAEDLRAAMARAEIEETVARNQRTAAEDPMLAWRTSLAAACTEEGVSYYWMVEDETTAAFYPGHHPVRMPDRVLDDLREQGANPHAVACHIKAISIDPRFASWDEEDDDE